MCEIGAHFDDLKANIKYSVRTHHLVSTIMDHHDIHIY